MWELTKGYKQGRAVMYYDMIDSLDSNKREMVDKDEVVKITEAGQVSNAKIQWWEGKPIVRLQNSTIELVKVDENKVVVGVAQVATRGGQTSTNSIKSEKQEKMVDVSSKAVVVGKVNSKKASKQNLAYTGYDTNYVVAQQNANNTIDLTGVNTVGDLFVTVAKEFNLRKVDIYLTEFNKKIRLDKPLSSFHNTEVKGLQSSIATYLMNMAHNEINEVYLKYCIR